MAFANLWQSGQLNELSIDLMRYKEVQNNEGKAVKSMMDYLFISLFMWGKEAGYHQFSLGMAPFTGFEPQYHPEAATVKSHSLKNNTSKNNTSNQETSESPSGNIIDNQYSETLEGTESIGPKWRYVTNTVTKYGKTYYNFTGLRNFKEKFNPEWEPRYIGIETGLRAGMKPIKGLTDTTLLISGGLGSFMKK